MDSSPAVQMTMTRLTKSSDASLDENTSWVGEGNITKNTSTTQISFLLNQASTFVKQRQLNEALHYCDKVLNLDPINETALGKKIKILCLQGKFPDAFLLASKWESEDSESILAAKEVKRLKIVMNALKDQTLEDEDNCPKTKSCEKPVSVECENCKPESKSSSSALRDDVAGDEKTKYECSYCSITFNKKEELETHCKSDLHKKRITSDEGQEWKYRPPPRGLSAEEYSLCSRFLENGKCSFGDKCTLAHSDGELKEWKDRFEFRKQSLQKAREQQLHGVSYIERLTEKLMNSENPDTVLVQTLEYVKLNVNSDLKVSMSNKKCTNSWTFTITSKVSLHRVALLDDNSRAYFHMSSISVGPRKTQRHQNIEQHCQEWINPDSDQPGSEFVYRVKVVFKTNIYGTFRQSIVCDFGSEPVLAREMHVESAPITDVEKLSKDFLLADTNKWNEESVKVVEFKPRPALITEADRKLLADYPLPQPNKLQLTESLMQPPNPENYQEWMHGFLYIEEIAQLTTISRFNVKTKLRLVNRFLLMPGTISSAKYAQNGELFGRMKLENDLSEDSMHGRLILQNTQMVFLALDRTVGESEEEPVEKVYEAIIEDRGKNFIFLRLSAACVTELQLSCDDDFPVQVQFQLNRAQKCAIHAAIDQLPKLDIVFPNLKDIPTLVQPQEQVSEELLDSRLNVKQREAILGITALPGTKLPPLLLLGPYGTGKTFTLAQAAKLVLQTEKTQILICTHSNSAADLYIKDFFHPYVADGHAEATPLRIYYRQRWIQTVSSTVLQYCLLETVENRGSTFRDPTIEDVHSHRVIVTTLSLSRILCDLGLSQGYFTHIFLDEAAQVMECESLIPLGLAGKETRIVLAGDHMQLSPDVYSDFARQQSFHRSLLERLYETYPEDSPCKIMLYENYRSHAAIVDFTSELFYDNKLTASGKQPAHNTFYPITFFTAKGEEVQHQNSTGFYNIPEVYEIAERAEELQRTWPDEWGPFDENSIGVVTPYADQVYRIRAELRKRKMHSVSVERVMNVQGKQFRVVILSTVRTRRSCSSDSNMEDYMDYGFLSNVKLLNTAITRAQSLVAVVGDPMSLCLFGKCRKVWEYFIEICHEHNSLYGMTWTQLRNLLDGAELKKTYVLNPLAPEFIPNRYFHNSQHGMFDGRFGPLMPPTFSPWGHFPSHLNHPFYPQFYPACMPFFPAQFYLGQHGPMYNPHVHSSSTSRGGSGTGNAPLNGVSAHRTGSPVRAGHTKAKSGAAAQSEQGTPDDQRGSDLVYGGKMSKPNKGQTMMYLPRLPPYHQGPFLPFYSSMPYYYPDDPRMFMIQHRYNTSPYMNAHHQPKYHFAHRGGGGWNGMWGSTSRGGQHNLRSRSEKGSHLSKEQRSSQSPQSSTAAGQAIQLLPNVKHVPPYLLSSQPGSSSSEVSTPVSQSPQLVPDDSSKMEPPDQKYSEIPAAAILMPSQSVTPDSSLLQGLTLKTEQVTEVSAFAPQIIENYEQPSMRELTETKGSFSRLQLTTGFSRQFSDDLETPTEITNLVHMIDESITEGNETPPAPTSMVVSSKESDNCSLSFGQFFKEKLAVDSDHTYPIVSKQLSVPWSMVSTEASHMENSDLLEPKTPRTPAGYSAVGVMDPDPLAILRNLNINASPGPKSENSYYP